MALKFVGKRTMGIVSMLILAMLLSQSRMFDFLTDTSLGRIVLVAFVVAISCAHRMLGLLAVLVIIVAFNYNDAGVVHSYTFYEGFEAPKTTHEPKAKKAKEHEKEKKTVVPVVPSVSKPAEAREGFCMSDRELNMLRGKQSNTVAVFNKSREQSNDVDPTNTSSFASAFASV